jgi:hypothetical protein
MRGSLLRYVAFRCGPRHLEPYSELVASVFKVRFADGFETFFGSVEEARRWIDLRADLDPPPPGILPAQIFELNDESPERERLVERYPSD